MWDADATKVVSVCAVTRWAIGSERVVTDGVVKPAVVIIDGERIARVCSADDPELAALHHLDLGRHVLMPGLVDSHVHINEPGRTAWEGFASATQAAAGGGVTTLVDMPLNSTPVTTAQGALATKIAAAADQLWVDCGFWGGVVPGNAGELAGLTRDGALGAKGFLCHSGIDDFPRIEGDELLAAMRALEKTGAPLLVHAELESDVSLPSNLPNKDYRRYLQSRPASWEDAAIAMMVALCERTGCPVHIVHLSSASALDILGEARGKGLPITVETCPHYLCLSAEDVPDGDTRFKCAPPIRDAANRAALWRGLKEGVIDFVVTDHSPCTPALKCEGDFMAAWGGIASLGLGLPSVWTQARRRGFALTDVTGWMCERPAMMCGLGARKGKLASGYDADLVVFDPEAEFEVDVGHLRFKNRQSPYLGHALKGAVMSTWLRGTKVFDAGAVLGPPRGTVVQRR